MQKNTNSNNMADITTSNFVCIEQTPATVADRILARIIDGVIVAIYTYSVFVFLSKTPHFSNQLLQIILVVTAILPTFTYTFLCEFFFNGQTIGKYAMKTRVVMADGSSPTAGALFLRYVCELVDIWMGFVGTVFIIATRRHQRLGDMAAGTMVIRRYDVNRMYMTIDEFAFARRGFKPTYDNAARLSPRQADILRRVVSSQQTDYERMERLARKVRKELDVPGDADTGDNYAFIQTVLNDYMYFAAMDNRV